MMKFPFPFFTTIKKIKKARVVAEEFVMGLHSGIPLCCVRYYCENMMRLDPSEMMNFGHTKSIEYGVNVGYVPCPTCALGIRYLHQEAAEVHHCDPDNKKCKAVAALTRYTPMLEQRRQSHRTPEQDARKITPYEREG